MATQTKSVRLVLDVPQSGQVELPDLVLELAKQGITSVTIHDDWSVNAIADGKFEVHLNYSE